jgi:hypothetical protein
MKKATIFLITFFFTTGILGLTLVQAAGDVSPQTKAYVEKMKERRDHKTEPRHKHISAILKKPVTK